MKKNQKIQYTIRNLSPQLDKALRQKANEIHKSLNEVVIDSLKCGIGLNDQTIVFHDLDKLSGSWNEDPEFDAALQMQDQVDPKLWL